ncbi:MAG: non-canonical purine NTP pyrophosphatase [Holosporales bacterium]|jgi:XTP/dITP diphosphohydrolase|nr:non-canonical purine NTP pyrophosphatase [Holosporales bacterium]
MKLKSNILLGTTNNEKIEEFLNSRILEKARVYTLKDFSFPDVDETGKTLKENALLKARYYFQQSGMPTISDDSGFFVKALNGFPGIYAARIAPDKNFEKAKESIAERLKGISDKSMTLSTALAYVDDKESIVIQNDVSGVYSYKTFPSKPDPFGYRDAFLPNGSSKTIADMTPREKIIFSPRSRALTELFDRLNLNKLGA